MRTTIDLPDTLFRQSKSVAALRGSSLKEFFIGAVEREIAASQPATTPKKHVKLPLVKLGRGRKVNVQGFNLDDILA